MVEKNFNFVKERTILELFNDSIKFIVQNFKIIFQIFLIFFFPLFFLSIFLSIGKSSFFDSALYQDLTQIINLQKYHAGFNVTYIILLGTGFSSFIYSLIYLSIDNSLADELSLKQIYGYLKPNIVSVIFLSLITTILISLIITVLIELDKEFQDAFSFSLFYLIYLLIPIFIYFYLTILYLTISKNLNFINAFEKTKTYFDSTKYVIKSVGFVLIIMFLLKYIFYYLFFLTVSILSIPIYENFIGIIFNNLIDIIRIVLIIFSVTYVAFLHNSQVARSENKDLIKLIDDL